MIQGQAIGRATAVEVGYGGNSPEPLVRGLAFGLPVSIGLWVGLALLIF